MITVHDMNSLSDHAPITAHLKEMQSETFIMPLAALRNDFLRKRIRGIYRLTILEVTQKIDNVKYWAFFERLTNNLVHEIVNTWIIFCPSDQTGSDRVGRGS